jgi:hypothetical protein
MGTAMPRQRIRPGRIWYLLALLAFAGGLAWIVFGLVSLNSQVNGFPRVPLPGGGTVTLDHAGGYIVYYEQPAFLTAANRDVSGFDVRVAPVSPGAAVGSLSLDNGDTTYQFGRRRGRALLDLRVAHPGTFRVTALGAQAGGAFGGDLAIGTGIAAGIVGIVLPAIALIFGGAGAGILIFVIRIVKTSRRGRAPAAS